MSGLSSSCASMGPAQSNTSAGGIRDGVQKKFQLKEVSLQQYTSNTSAGAWWPHKDIRRNDKEDDQSISISTFINCNLCFLLENELPLSLSLSLSLSFFILLAKQ